MHSLWLTRLSSNRLLNIKALRDALRVLAPAETPPQGAGDAIKLLNIFEEDGIALVGEARSALTVRDALERLRAIPGCDGELDLSIERAADKGATAKGATPEEVFAANAPGEPPEEETDTDGVSAPAYQTAMALLAGRNGNPLEAAAQAKLLAHTAEDDFYYEVMGALMLTFPWLGDMLNKQGVI